MRYMRTALLCAGVVALAAGAAVAQPASQGMVLYDAEGRPVAVLTPLNGGGRADAAAAGDPAIRMLREMEATMASPFDDGGVQRLIAAQEASMRAMEHAMDVAMQGVVPEGLRGPGQTIEVAVPPGGNGVVTGSYVWSIASGQGHCAETVTFTYSGDGRQFVQRKTGKVCGKQDYGKTGTLPAMIAPPRPLPGGSRLFEVSSPPQASQPLHG